MTTSSTVYFIPLQENESPSSIAKKAKQLFKYADFASIISPDKLVALKQHFGEKGNEGYIKADITKTIADKIKAVGGKPLLVETNTLYHGQRSNTYNHLMQAYEHGFNPERIGIPAVIMDGVNGQNQRPVAIPGKHFKEVFMVSDLPFFDSIFVLSHVKGHLASGFGGAIKNLAMGFSSRAGKLAQHADFVPSIKQEMCIRCGQCIGYCPSAALTIEDDLLKLDEIKCIGCGECYAACPEEAIAFDWGSTDEKFQEKMAEHAYGAVIKHPQKVAYLNIFNYVTRYCDCWGTDNPRLYRDVGIFASYDPVAIDKAAYDVGKDLLGKDVFKEFWPEIDPLIQLEHAERIGLGTMSYSLEECG